MHRSRRFPLALLALALAAVGCGGGSGGGGTIPPAAGDRLLSTSGAATARVHDPVILVPGMTSPAAEMEPMKSEFVNAGWSSDRVFTWTDSTDMEGDLATAARELQTEVKSVLAQTEARHVVLVTWSAAALAGRYYIKNLDDDKVSVYVGMAGPQHGTTFNDCQAYESCREFMAPNTPFLTALNARTEVPGSPHVAYMTVRSDNDFNVAPEDSAMLKGANLNDRLSGATAPNHFQYPVDATTFDHVKTFILEVENHTQPKPGS